VSRKIRFVGRFSDPQIDMQIVEIVKVAQGLIDDTSEATENIGDLWNAVNNKETPGGAQAKANQAETNAKQYADGKIAEALNDSKEYTDSQIEGIETHPPIGGPTGERPLAPFLYGCYFDTTLGIPIWWDGTKWVDAGGVAV
jgi:hypothetical protein